MKDLPNDTKSYTECNPDDRDNDIDVVVHIENPVYEPSSESSDLLSLRQKWLEIPVTGIEQWINKDGAATITRTAKVTALNEFETFEESWTPVFVGPDFVGDQNAVPETPKDTFLDIIMREVLIEDSKFHTNFPKCRIVMYDEQSNEWNVTHYGYIGGYGPTDNSLLRKFWVYDISDIMKRLPVGKVFSKPTVNDLVRFVVEGTDDTGTEVGVNNATPFEIQSVEFPDSENVRSKVINQLTEDEAGIVEQIGAAAVPFLAATGIGGLFSNPQRQYTRNRNNMIDVLNDIATAIDGGWQFRPTVDGPVLEFRANISETEYGKRFTDISLEPEDGVDEYTVETYDNTALSDIKPINTITVNGNESINIEEERDTVGFDLGLYEAALQQIEGAGISSSFTEEYPSVTLTYDPYLRAANGIRYGPTNVEAPTDTIEETRKYAFDEFIAHVEESTEGEITVRGDPYIVPNDTIRTPPACLGNRPENPVPITYEVNEVYHKKFAGEPFKTELGVHAAIQKTDEDGNSTFTVQTETKQAQ